MAISATHYFIVRSLFEHGMLPQNGALLEIGEANLYPDVDPKTIAEDIRKFVTDPQRRDALLQRLADVIAAGGDRAIFDLVKVVYEMFFAPVEMQAVDFGGSDTALRLDLNYPLELSRRFEIVINHGTAEHIFNIGQVFKSIHDYTVPSGLMIHESPFTGWIDHGFYNLQPTLFFDVAERNQYVVCGMFATEIKTASIRQIKTRDDVYQMAQEKLFLDNSMLLTVMKKMTDLPFQIPIQGYYRESLSDAGMRAWRSLR